MESGSTRKFKVKTMDGRVTEFETQPDISVEELKTEIASKMNVPSNRQRLVFKSRLLKEDQKLSDHVTQDGEIIHMMAMSEEQARSRSNIQRERAGSNPQPSALGGNVPRQGAPNPPQDPFSGMFGMLGNLMQGMNVPQGNNPTGHTHISHGTLDLSQLFGQPPAQARAPASNSNSAQPNQPNSRSNINTNPVTGSIRIETTPIIRISSRSGSRTRDATRSSVNMRRTEENKNGRSASGTRNTIRIALPHNHIYETNMISNDLMGPGAAFPGPPLPPNGQPRTPANILGSYLGSLQFAMSRVNPYIWRSGELLQRESNIVNPIERAESQLLINQTGRALEQLARALLLSAHYYRDLRLGEAPGHITVANTPHPDFLELNERFCSQNFPGDSANQPRSTATSSRPSQPTTHSTFAPGQSSSASSQPQNNPLGTMFQNILTPENLNNVAGLLGNLGGVQGFNLGARPAASTNQPASASNASGTGQSDVNLEPAEERKDTSRPENEEEEKKQAAEHRQENINSRFIEDFTNIASTQNNPLGQVFQSMMPLISGTMDGSGNNPMTSRLSELFPNDVDNSSSFVMKVLTNCTIEDLLAILNGNYQVVTHLHPRTKDILLTDYMNGQDTPENRQTAVNRISNEINNQLVIPDELIQQVAQGSNPLEVAEKVNKKHIKKMVNTILDSEHNPNDNTAFIKRMKRVLRWWVGDFIDSLKPCFDGQLPDVLKFIRGNIERTIRGFGDPTFQMMSGMFTDSIMKSVQTAYQDYLKDKKREDEAEAREQGISLEELYKRRQDSQRQSEMEVDPPANSEPRIQEESVNHLQSRSAQPTNATPITTNAQPQEERKQAKPKTEEEKFQEKVEEEKDPEIKQLLEQMEEDQSMLVVDPPSKKPKSRAYRALDVYYQNNIESGDSITEKPVPRTTAKDDVTKIFKSALKDYGFRNEDIEKNMAANEITDEFVDHFKDVVREEIKERKKDQEYEQGRFPNLDKL